MLFKKDVLYRLTCSQKSLEFDLTANTIITIGVYETLAELLFTMALRREQLPLLELPSEKGIQRSFDNIISERWFPALLKAYKSQDGVRALVVLNHMKGMVNSEKQRFD